MGKVEDIKNKLVEVKGSLEELKVKKVNDEKLDIILNRGSEEMKRFADKLTIEPKKLEEFSKRCVQYDLDDVRSCTDEYEYNVELRGKLKESLKQFIKAYVELTGNPYIYYGEFFHISTLRTIYSKSYIQLGLILLTGDYDVFVEYPEINDINLIKFRPTSFVKAVFSKDSDFCEFETVNEEELDNYKNKGRFYGYADVFISDPDFTIRNNVRDILDERSKLIESLKSNNNHTI